MAETNRQAELAALREWLSGLPNVEGVRIGEHEHIPCIVHGVDSQVKKLPELLEYPTRMHATVKVREYTSLITYLMQRDVHDVMVFFDGKHTIEAILDWVQPGSVPEDRPVRPGWRCHRVVCTLPMSPEWRQWNASNGNNFDQMDFAELLEDRADDIVSYGGSPDAATMLEVAQNLSVTRNAEFGAEVRTTSGATSLAYEEQLTGRTTTTKSGTVEFPPHFYIEIPVYEGGHTRYRIKVRLRYRLAGSKLSFHYKLHRPELAQQKENERIVGVLEAEEAIEYVIMGEAPGAHPAL